jgi:hypothetical protein
MELVTVGFYDEPVGRISEVVMPNASVGQPEGELLDRPANPSLINQPDESAFESAVWYRIIGTLLQDLLEELDSCPAPSAKPVHRLSNPPKRRYALKDRLVHYGCKSISIERSREINDGSMHGGHGNPMSARYIDSIKFSCAMKRDVWVAKCGSTHASQVDGFQGKGWEVPSGGCRVVGQDASFNGQKGGDGLLKTRP